MDFEELTREQLEALDKYIELFVGFVKRQHEFTKGYMNEEYREGANAIVRMLESDRETVQEALEVVE